MALFGTCSEDRFLRKKDSNLSIHDVLTIAFLPGPGHYPSHLHNAIGLHKYVDEKRSSLMPGSTFAKP
jgi:hypothetical protein